MSYYEPQQIVKGGSLLFIRASNDLYSYNLNDHSITTYDKVNSLNDNYITHIAWSNTAQQLIIVYENANIDLMKANGSVTNIGALYNKSMTQDKTVNNIYIYNQFAYLSTNFGVVKVNMERAEVSESYILNKKISHTAVSGNNIYVRTTEGTILTAPMSSNLIDYHNWTTGTLPDPNLFTADTADWNNYIETVRTLLPGGPKYNYFGVTRFQDNVLYCSGGGYTADIDLHLNGTIQTMTGNEWTFLQDDFTGVDGTEGSWTFVDITSLDIDPRDSRHLFASGKSGLFEYYDGQLQKYYHINNSILQTAVENNNKYVLTESVKFDSEGNLWLLQSQVKDNSLMKITTAGVLESLPQEELMENGLSLAALRSLFIDSEENIWFVNDHWGKPSVFCYNPKTDQIVINIKQLVNQDGKRYTQFRPHCLTEDFEGNIWIGTDIGPFLVEKSNLYDADTYVTQVKVPRNDGTNYADYLLDGVNISAIAIDGGGRKWIGTYGAGVYLISADNMTQIHNFTTSNSPLLSDNIESISINNKTGEVFFGTNYGLCSYMSDATEAVPQMVKDNVYAYPNPVVSGYDGLITVVGLSLNADVKILTANGQLVAQGRSNGGTFTWDGRDRSGKTVASGVYMVVTATSDGKKGTVCKIAVIN